jgi:hypothetical protein
MPLDREKLKALVHYICRTCGSPDKLGKTKLHKIVWLAESYCYSNQGQQVTGETFIREQYGPFAVHVNSVVEELVKAGDLYVREVPYFGKIKTEYTASGEPRRDLFTERQLRVIDETIRNICHDHTASSISEKSHDHVWEIAALKEPLPIGVFLLRRLAPITDDDIAWAKGEIANLAN